MSRSRRAAVLPPSTEWLDVESIDLEGQGVAHDGEGKVVFIEGALTGERVQIQPTRRKAHWTQGVVTSVARESASRVRPRCPHFGLHAGACGGCKVQHLEASAQVAVKQRALEDALSHIGKVKPDLMLRPLVGLAWGYRDRARLSVRHVARKGAVLVGFHERQSSYVADMRSCDVLAPRVSALLIPLRELVMAMDGRDRLPQVEVAVGGETVALVLRHLEPLSAPDLERLRGFARAHAVQWWLQPKGPETVAPLDADDAFLAYRLPEFGLHMQFLPTDFTQVNHHVNAALVSKGLKLLDPQPHETVIDWFCGLGNFSLPLATRSRSVLGIEGSAALVVRATANAQRHGLASTVRFEAANLFEVSPRMLLDWPQADAWLVDPPREGAMALCRALADMRQQGDESRAPSRIVYISCNPATLARDAGLLVHQAGYILASTGVVNMFAHTAHVESMACFTKGAVPVRAEGGPPLEDPESDKGPEGPLEG